MKVVDFSAKAQIIADIDENRNSMTQDVIGYMIDIKLTSATLR